MCVALGALHARWLPEVLPPPRIRAQAADHGRAWWSAAELGGPRRAAVAAAGLWSFGGPRPQDAHWEGA